MINLEFNSIFELLESFPDNDSCIRQLEAIRWENGVVSPFDVNSKVYRCKNGRYKCKNSGKYFNVRTGTMFDNTKIGLQKWFLAIYLITSHKKGISSIQLSKDIGITQKSAWFMSQRIRACFGITSDDKLDNEVEIDETYVGGKNKNRHKSKRISGTQGRSTKDKSPVLGLLQRAETEIVERPHGVIPDRIVKEKIVHRGSKLKAIAIKDTKARTILPIISNEVSESATVYTDEWGSYRSLDGTYDRESINHGSGEYVRGAVHTNTIEGFWSLFKRGILGIYHQTSKKHLQKYINEFEFRYNTREKSECSRMGMMLSMLEVKTTYKSLISV